MARIQRQQGGAAPASARDAAPVRKVPPWAPPGHRRSPPLLLRPDARRNPGSASAVRLTTYCGALCLGAYRSLHEAAPPGPTWLAGLVNDTQKGLVAIAPPAPLARIGVVTGASPAPLARVGAVKDASWSA